MTIANQTNRTSVVGSGATGQVVPFSFPISATSDLTVIKRITATGVPTDLTETTNYTIIITGDTGGTLTTVTAIETNETIHIIRNTPLTQSLDLEQGGSFHAENLENAIDKNTKLIIENSDALERTLVFPATDPSGSFANMPNSVDRASKNLTFDSDGKPTASVSIEEGSVTHTDFGKTIAEAADADTARGLLELDTDDDVEFEDVISSGPWADIRKYGADTANADNATAIQAAFDSGKSVLIPEGTFIVLSTLTWTTDNATLMFVSHNSIIKAGATFPLDTPIIHFAGGVGDAVIGCSVYNLSLRSEQRATGVLLTYTGQMRFYSLTLHGCRDGDNNYAFDIIGTHGHTGTIWVHGMHIYGSGESGGIRIDGDGYNVLDCGFRDIKIQLVRHGIYLKADAYSCYFSSLMIDCTSTNAGTFAIKESTDNNSSNIFHDVHCENTSANGTGIDMQSTTSVSTMWDYWVDNFATKTVFDDDISTKTNFRIDGVRVRSRNRILVLHGAFDGYSPDSTMTWGDVRSAIVAGDNTWDKWDFVLPLPNRSIIKTITNQFATDDGNADLRMQVWKQNSELATWTQVGSDHDFTGSGGHTATIDYEIEINYVVKISILAKRAAGTYLYVYPLNVKADY